MDSILTTVKKMLGIEDDYTHFDTDIIIHINTIFTILNQLGVGPSEGFSITDKTSKWVDFATKGQMESIKTYIYLRVRLLFDPPSNSFLVEAIKNQIQELEWRLNVQSEGGN